MWRKYSTADKGEKGLLSYVERIHDFVVTATDHFYLRRVEKLPMLFPVLVKTNQKSQHIVVHMSFSTRPNTFNDGSPLFWG